MNAQDVYHLLEDNKNERGIANASRNKIANFNTFGIGLTQLKKLAKHIGRSHELAQELWKHDIYDMRVISVLIEEPKKVTRAQIEAQIADLEFWMFSHVYATTLLAKVKFQPELIADWYEDKNHVKRRLAYNMIYNLLKNDKTLGDDYYAPFLDIIERDLQSEENMVRDAMNNALGFIGKYRPALRVRVLSAAQNIGPVEVDYGDNSCKPLDVAALLSRS